MLCCGAFGNLRADDFVAAGRRRVVEDDTIGSAAEDNPSEEQVVDHKATAAVAVALEVHLDA